MTETLITAFVILFIVVDPIGVSIIFAGLTHQMPPPQRRRIAIRGTALGLIILLVFAFAGDALMTALGISIPAFRIAGGALFFLLAIDMVFARQSGLRSTTDLEREEASGRDDISVFPLAFPLITGPGAITSVLLMTAGRHDDAGFMISFLGVILVIFALTLAALLTASRILALLGETGSNVISRVLGLVLAALAVQYMLDGLREGLLGG